ncbi:HD domain-containing protein [Saccharicrinis fermentans]|uniref:HD/PDEase domain-containing protein n=1 Tax=Saccharicrinis fermentans DSM 9555 = JCM 21142 TaxID=869213 RepID=W7YIG8_9BACT|nr:HD domain-containing protein [Saccharicrinis fermentans]GAF04271.1 hypothetical protein JCM21142_72968 [Saccharicrinis fermentans DSM 9555 = JCM 21142]
MTDTVYSKLVNDCLTIAREEITANKNEKLYHHNLEHTINVLEVVSTFAINIPEVSPREMELLQIAAIFHDVCFYKGVMGHEKKSADFAREFLESRNMDNRDIITVERIIMATRLAYEPTDILEEIIRDADIAHVGYKDYLRNPFINLFKEINCFRKKTPNQWINDCIVFFEQHPFYTNFAKQILNKQKEKNKEKLTDLLKMDIKTEDELLEKTAGKKKKKKEDGNKKPDKGIETMFRVNLRNHVI